MTIGDYMADKLNETDGAIRANAYFNALLKIGRLIGRSHLGGIYDGKLN